MWSLASRMVTFFIQMDTWHYTMCISPPHTFRRYFSSEDRLPYAQHLLKPLQQSVQPCHLQRWARVEGSLRREDLWGPRPGAHCSPSPGGSQRLDLHWAHSQRKPQVPPEPGGLADQEDTKKQSRTTENFSYIFLPVKYKQTARPMLYGDEFHLAFKLTKLAQSHMGCHGNNRMPQGRFLSLGTDLMRHKGNLSKKESFLKIHTLASNREKQL